MSSHGTTNLRMNSNHNNNLNNNLNNSSNNNNNQFNTPDHKKRQHHHHHHPTIQTPTRTLTTGQRWSCYLITFFSIAALTFTNYPDVIAAYTHKNGAIVAKIDDIVTVPLRPNVDTILGVDHYYLFPPPPQKIKGVLIFLHSCKKSGLEFFHLPEDRIVAYDALQQGLAIFAPTSQHRESGCYTSMDLDWVDQVVSEWTNKHKLNNNDNNENDIPRMGMAVSSGASFLFFVHKALQLKSMAVYNTPQSFLFDDIEKKQAIPTVFISMPLDVTIATQMEANHGQLLDSNIPTRLYKVTPHPFTSALCLARLPEMIASDCDEIFDTMIHNNNQDTINNNNALLDADDFIKEPFNVDQWQALLGQIDEEFHIDENYYLQKRAHSGHSWLYAGLEQEIRTCEAFHAMTVEHHSAIIAFLMKHAGIDNTNTKKNSN